MVCKAYAILMVTHGPTHPITKDLEVKDSGFANKAAFKCYIFSSLLVYKVIILALVHLTFAHLCVISLYYNLCV